MIKDLFKIFIKYIMIFVITSLVLFSAMLFYNLLPLFKLKLSDTEIKTYLKVFFAPSFYHSIINSLVISITLFGVSILNYQKKNRVIAFFIPLILSTLIIYFFYNIFNPKKSDLTLSHVDDARLIFSEKTFFEYNGQKLFFDSIGKNKINNIIFINNGKVAVDKEGFLKFEKDRIRFESLNHKIDFMKDSLHEYNAHKRLINYDFFSLFFSMSRIFLYSSSLYSNLFLWFSIAFFILAFTIIAKVKNYPMLSIIYNLILLIVFYYFFNNLFELYHKYASDFFAKQITRELFFSSLFLLAGILIYLIQLAFLKSHHWED